LELLHRDGTALIARVIDRGPGMGTVGPAQRPPTSAVRGRGRWIMSEYCDSVDYRTSSAGTTVELCVNLTHTDG
jgi:anti-sigma regulatory factor (Ser/Thr protein kinase)